MMRTVEVLVPVTGLIDRLIWLSNALASRPRCPIQGKEHRRREPAYKNSGHQWIDSIWHYTLRAPQQFSRDTAAGAEVSG